MSASLKELLKNSWEYDENGSYVYKSNLGDVSDGGDNRIIEGHIINEYYLKEPYKGDATSISLITGWLILPEVLKTG